MCTHGETTRKGRVTGAIWIDYRISKILIAFLKPPAFNVLLHVHKHTGRGRTESNCFRAISTPPRSRRNSRLWANWWAFLWYVWFINSASYDDKLRHFGRLRTAASTVGFGQFRFDVIFGVTRSMPTMIVALDSFTHASISPIRQKLRKLSRHIPQKSHRFLCTKQRL